MRNRPDRARRYRAALPAVSLLGACAGAPEHPGKRFEGAWLVKGALQTAAATPTSKPSQPGSRVAVYSAAACAAMRTSVYCKHCKRPVGVHPASIIIAGYLNAADAKNSDEILERIRAEHREIGL